MSKETLLTAARRVVREFNIVMHDGGLINTHLEQAMDTLDKQVRAEAELAKKIKVSYVTNEIILNIEERFSTTPITGTKAKSISLSLGWYIQLEGSNESFYISETKPDLDVGDRVRITLEKVTK